MDEPFPVILIGIYCLLIVAFSLLGGWLPTLVRLTHVRMQYILSFVGGFMLGIGLLHLLPHSAVVSESLEVAVISTTAGLLAMFLLLRAFDFHQHASAELDEHEHAVHHHHQGEESHDHVRATSWWAIGIGLAIHAIIDGIALGAAVQSDSLHGHDNWLYGFGVFFAILLHKPLDSISVIALMTAGGWSKQSCALVNVVFSLLCPIGAALTMVGINPAPHEPSLMLGIALGFSAGTFLCISLSDLLPEVQFHRHDKTGLSVTLIVGVALAYAIGLLESHEAHQLPSGSQHSSQQEDTDAREF